MSMMRWDPIGEMMSLREAMDRLFEETFGVARPVSRQRGFPVDVYEQGDDIVVEADMPGVRPEDVDIQVHGNQLVIDAQSRREQEIERQDYYRRERTFQRYSRVVPLPASIEADQAEASFQDGTLRIRLPKSEEARARRIEVRSRQGELAGQSREIPIGTEQQSGGQQS